MNVKLALCVALVATLTQMVSCQQAADEHVVGALRQAAAAPAERQEESYQRVYEAFTKLLQNVGNNSLGNARRLVTRLNQLVGTSGQQQQQQQTTQPAGQKPVDREQQSVDDKTEQILNRLDQVNKNTDQHTLRQLQDDVNRLVGTLSDSYLRNIRRVIERVNKTIGGSNSDAVTLTPPAGALHQSGDRFSENEGPRQPGFPGWDELITAVDRMQKSFASFVRSSTKLITAGRR